jgi:hypothetical protein
LVKRKKKITSSKRFSIYRDVTREQIKDLEKRVNEIDQRLFAVEEELFYED